MIALSVIGLIEKEPEKNESFKSAGFDHIVDVLTDEDKEAFAKAGQELATIAINEPAKHLLTLQRLKWLTEDKVQPVDIWRKVQKGLVKALPTTMEKSPERSEYKGTLEDLFIQELKTRD